MSPKVLSVEKEEGPNAVTYKRIIRDEILGKIYQMIIITKDSAVRRSWSGWGYTETSLKRIKTKDGKDAIDVVWGHEGEGRSDWHWCIIIPPDVKQIDWLFEAVRDLEKFDEIQVRLHNEVLAKNVNKRIECDLSFLFS